MAVVHMFSKRQKREQGELPDADIYDQLPLSLRIQIIWILREICSEIDNERILLSFNHRDAFSFIVENVAAIMNREYGTIELYPGVGSHAEELLKYFQNTQSSSQALDFVDLAFHHIYEYQQDPDFRSIENVILRGFHELNSRFREHMIDYKFENGNITRLDSEYIHSVITRPTMELLTEEKFKGANEEFHKARDHYRHGRYEEAIVDSLKAFESIMKTICVIRGWTFEEGGTAKNLIDTLLKNELVPRYIQSQFNSLRTLLESGVPTIRNKQAAHGQGTQLREVPEYLARYALNLAATNILFLYDAHQSSPQKAP